MGLCAIVRPFVVSGNMITLEYPVLAPVTLLRAAVCDDGSINRLDAVLFLALYVGFSAYRVSRVRRQMTENEAGMLHGEVHELAEVARRPPSTPMRRAFSYSQKLCFGLGEKGGVSCG